MSGPSHPRRSCRHPLSWTDQSLWFWSHHMLSHPPIRCYLCRTWTARFRVWQKDRLKMGLLSNNLLVSTWLEVVVDDGGFDFVEVTQGADNLHDDGASLFLGHQLILLQVEVQVVSFTELKDCAESDEETRTCHPGDENRVKKYFPSILFGAVKTATVDKERGHACDTAGNFMLRVAKHCLQIKKLYLSTQQPV